MQNGSSAQGMVFLYALADTVLYVVLVEPLNGCRTKDTRVWGRNMGILRKISLHAFLKLILLLCKF